MQGLPVVAVAERASHFSRACEQPSQPDTRQLCPRSKLRDNSIRALSVPPFLEHCSAPSFAASRVCIGGAGSARPEAAGSGLARRCRCRKAREWGSASDAWCSAAPAGVTGSFIACTIGQVRHPRRHARRKRQASGRLMCQLRPLRLARRLRTVCMVCWPRGAKRRADRRTGCVWCAVGVDGSWSYGTLVRRAPDYQTASQQGRRCRPTAARTCACVRLREPREPCSNLAEVTEGRRARRAHATQQGTARGPGPGTPALPVVPYLRPSGQCSERAALADSHRCHRHLGFASHLAASSPDRLNFATDGPKDRSRGLLGNGRNPGRGRRPALSPAPGPAPGLTAAAGRGRLEPDLRCATRNGALITVPVPKLRVGSAGIARARAGAGRSQAAGQVLLQGAQPVQGTRPTRAARGASRGWEGLESEGAQSIQ